MVEPPSSDPLSIAIVVPVYNKRHCVEEAIGSVLAAVSDDPQIELRIIDNGSTDGTLEWLRRVAPEGALLECDAGTISGVRNFGARHSQAAVLAFLDSDVLIPRDFTHRLRRVFRDEAIDASGCECGLPPQAGWVAETWYRLTVRRGDGPRRYINSANLAVRRQGFRAIGGFPEDFVTGEDYEFCRRLVAGGHVLRQSMSLEVAHLDNPRSLRQFVRKSYWHGLGAVRAAPPGRINLPVASALAHAIAAALSVGVVVTGMASGQVWLAWLGLTMPWLVPVLLYSYRVVLVRRFVNPVRGLVLCQAFLTARAVALLSVWLGMAGERS